MQAEVHGFPTRSLNRATKQLAELGIEGIASRLGTSVGSVPIIQTDPLVTMSNSSTDARAAAMLTDLVLSDPPAGIPIPHQLKMEGADDLSDHTPLVGDPTLGQLDSTDMLTEDILVQSQHQHFQQNVSSAQHSEVSSLASLDDLGVVVHSSGPFLCTAQSSEFDNDPIISSLLGGQQ